MNSRAKGKRGELAAVALLKSLGFTARRTQQYSGTAGTSDVVADELPYVHIEVKIGGTLGDWRPGSPRLAKACAQAKRDCPPRHAWVVMHKPDRGAWLFTLEDRTITAEYAAEVLGEIDERAEYIDRTYSDLFCHGGGDVSNESGDAR